MAHSEQHLKWLRGLDFWAALAATVLAVLLLALASRVEAQTYTILHNFTGCRDGDYPSSTLIWDRAGNLYGTSGFGGVPCNCDDDGVANSSTQARWVLNPLHELPGGTSRDEGDFPLRRELLWGRCATAH